MGRDEFNDKNIQHPPLRFYDKHNVFWYWVLSGIMANLNEFWYYQTTYNKFCVPTYFTFLGIINIQKRTKSIPEDIFIVYKYIEENRVSKNEILYDHHTLFENENYGLNNGKLQLRDYGNYHCNPFLKFNGKKLATAANALDLS